MTTARGRSRTAAHGGEPVWDALSDLVTETMMFHRQWARRQGLTPLQFTVLKMVLTNGPRQPSQIAEQFGISRSAVSGEINTLEAAGWVVRSHPRGDRRKLLTSLTPKARRVLDRAGEEYRSRLLHGLSKVAAEERSRLARTLQTLVAQLRELREGDPPAPSRFP